MKKKTSRSPATKTKAMSLHIGLNAVNPTDYAGWSGPLSACEFDANDMAAIARSSGMKSDRAADQEGDARERVWPRCAAPPSS